MIWWLVALSKMTELELYFSIHSLIFFSQNKTHPMEPQMIDLGDLIK